MGPQSRYGERLLGNTVEYMFVYSAVLTGFTSLDVQWIHILGDLSTWDLAYDNFGAVNGSKQEEKHTDTIK